MSEDQLIRQVLQGGGNMPAFGKSLSAPQTTALVQFLMTLRGSDLQPAMVPAVQLTKGNRALPRKSHGDPSLVRPNGR